MMKSRTSMVSHQLPGTKPRHACRSLASFRIPTEPSMAATLRLRVPLLVAADPRGSAVLVMVVGLARVQIHAWSHCAFLTGRDFICRSQSFFTQASATVCRTLSVLLAMPTRLAAYCWHFALISGVV